jgi:hypothetical protein
MYNASLLQIDGKTKQIIGVHLARVDAEGRVVASTWMQRTGLEGSTRYERILATTGCSFQVVQDGGRLFFQTVGSTSTLSSEQYSPRDS